MSVVQQTFILSLQLSPHQAADGGSFRSGVELAKCMKELTLLLHSASELLLILKVMQIQLLYIPK